MILDGAVATELQRTHAVHGEHRPPDNGLWGTWALYKAPDAVLDVHRRYVDAACDVLKQHPADEVLLSTLPAGISRWLHFDVPSRMRAAVSVPVVVLTATGAAAPTPA